MLSIYYIIYYTVYEKFETFTKIQKSIKNEKTFNITFN